MILWMLLPKALAADPLLDKAVMDFRSSYTECQKVPVDSVAQNSIDTCKNALTSVQNLSTILENHPEWSAAKLLPPKLKICESNLKKAVATLQRNKDQRDAASIVTNGGMQVVAVMIDRSELADSIYFEPNSSHVSARYSIVIQGICETALSQYRTTLEVQGYDDNRRSTKKQSDLAEARATEVAKALIGCGISAENIKILDYVDDYFTGNNRTAEGREENRRVEVRTPRLVPDPELK